MEHVAGHQHVYPWWLGYFLICPLRRLLGDPARILSPYVHEGMTVLEPGPGMGFFTLELARMVGASGRVIALDIQPRMIERLKRRAARAGLLERIDARVVEPHSPALNAMAGAADFVLAFAVVHELPDTREFFVEAARAMKPDAGLLLAEPRGPVSTERFDSELHQAGEASLEVVDRPTIGRNRAAVLRKS
jgi:SAM-dependent methyltransferase